MSEQLERIENKIDALDQKVETIQLWSAKHEIQDTQLRANVAKLGDVVKPIADDYVIRRARMKWVSKIMIGIAVAVGSSLVFAVLSLL